MRRQHENQPFVCGDVGQLRLFRQGDHAMRLRPDIGIYLYILADCCSSKTFIHRYVFVCIYTYVYYVSLKNHVVYKDTRDTAI